MSSGTPFGKHPDLLVRQQDPFNGGPPQQHVRRSFLTPKELFFVRNHGAVPEVDLFSYRLTVAGRVKRPLRFSLEEIHRLPKVKVTATLQCAGNRRDELVRVAPIPHELEWHSEAISTAEWAGVRLRDLLAAVDPEADARHVAFVGLDETERLGQRFCFGGSIPLDKALGPEVLLAYEMNGEPLPPVHGAPLRVVVPGYIGARSVKWLSTVTLQGEPSDNYFQARAYRMFPPHIGRNGHDGVDWDSGLMLGELSVSSVITSPLEGAELPAGAVTVQGWAMAGGGRTVARVDLSTDGGRTWTVAALQPDSRSGPWSWRLWEGRLELAPGAHEIVCRAWDSATHTQPEDPAHVWNFKGYMNNAWHRVRVTCAG
ncbi:MAG TPA: molybdopterin-dependent oxidoreductase [Thermoanaerobaculia bacterium]|nr:molybdopterin-dependent oxidoreductase [Thermoanaerobaculia bacterium]